MAGKPMDPFARRMLQGTFVYGGVMLVMFAVLTVVYLHTHPRCSDRVVAEAASPRNQWTAAVLELRCGEDAPFFTHVILRPSEEMLKRGYFSGSVEEGEVFRIEQDAAGAGLALEWTGPDSLVIRCPQCSSSFLRKQENRWQGITINYELPSR